jgi:hypothetical protein
MILGNRRAAAALQLRGGGIGAAFQNDLGDGAGGGLRGDGRRFADVTTSGYTLCLLFAARCRTDFDHDIIGSSVTTSINVRRSR